MGHPLQPIRFRLLEPLALTRNERLLRIGVFLVCTGSVAMVSVVGGAYVYFAPSVPGFESLDDYQPKVGTRIYSADNQLIGEFAVERRVLVPADKVPKQLHNAFIAAEDKRFNGHGGLDFIGITQAVLSKILHPSRRLRGASTITQQVAKSLLATHESWEQATTRTVQRKIREAILARRLERALEKEEILYLYVNQVFLGHKAYGVQAAAEHYFRKNVWELSLAEMATLAGLPQRPSDYSPYSRPDAARARRRYVLRRMEEDGYISAEQAKAAAKEEVKVYARTELYLKIAPYYTEQVRREIVDRYGERALLEDGLQVYTAVNIQRQVRGQQAIARGLRALDKRQGFRGPLAHIDRRLWALFVHRYRQELGLSEGAELEWQKSQVYLALVTKTEEKLATLEVAGQVGLLPLAAMRWARWPNPTQRVDLHYLKDVRRALKVGDVISVRPTSRSRIGKDPHGWEILDTVPEKGDLFALDQEPIAQAALLSVDPHSGFVVAQVGGYSFEESTYNRAVQACREPGSAFKPIVYSAAIDKLDFTASTLIDDKPIIFDDPDNEVRWKPNNAGERFRGELPLRTCLKDSINTPAIRIAEAVGIEDLIKNARNLGITTPLKRELGTALGSSCTTLHDLIQVYTTMNQYGIRRPIRFIRSVVDRFGNILEDNSAPWDPTLSWTSRLDRAYQTLVTPENRVLDQQTAFLMTSLLHNVVKEGTAIAASRMGHTLAGKTGTTNDSYDAWFMAFSPNLVTGVWVGHDKKERPLGVSEQGGRTALPIWVDYTRGALTDYTVSPPRRIDDGDFEPPTGVVQVTIDPETGLLARPNAPRTVKQYYRAGTEPTEYAPDLTTLSPDEFDVYNVDTPL